MSKITIDQFCAQWRNGNYRMLGSKLFYNAQDFVTAAGEYAKQQFQSSFERGGFNGSIYNQLLLNILRVISQKYGHNL